MIAICVDDEPLAMEYTVSQCRQIPLLTEVKGFVSAGEALGWVRSHRADLAILDISMPEMSGIVLAEKLKAFLPGLRILFLTAYREYAFEAYSAHPSGYLLKPVSLKKLTEEVTYVLSGIQEEKLPRIRARTFGNFELFVDGAPLVFPRSKAKELLAYLIDREGAGVSRALAFSVLFEEEDYTRKRQKYFDVIVRTLRDTLEEYGIGDLIGVGGGTLRVHAEMLDCDLYRFLKGDREAMRAYGGEYMNGYPWAGVREAGLDWTVRDREGQ